MMNRPQPDSDNEEYLEQVTTLCDNLSNICDDYSHGGATVAALITTLCRQLHDLIISNKAERAEMIRLVKNDIDVLMAELNDPELELAANTYYHNRTRH